jgi:hypothetical protein
MHVIDVWTRMSGNRSGPYNPVFRLEVLPDGVRVPHYIELVPADGDFRTASHALPLQIKNATIEQM